FGPETEPKTHRTLVQSAPQPPRRLRASHSLLSQVGERVNGGIGGSFLVQEVMEEEWRAMQASSGSFPSLWRKENISQAMVAEIESILQFEDDCLDSVVGMSAENLIVCPVCNRNYLTVTSCFVLCQCGVYINCKSQGMNSEKLQSLLELNLSAHANGCSKHPAFSVVLDAEGVSSLFMSCTVSIQL
ncbi:hypothetical protein AB205_0038360, partial [Aquarana catesbeiana]